MANKKMDENRVKRNGKEKGNAGLQSFCFLPPHANLGRLAYNEVDKVDFAYIENVSTRRLNMYVFPFLSTVG